MKQNNVKQLEKEKADLSRSIAEEIKKRDNFIVEQSKIIEDLYAQFDVIEAKLDAALRNKNQKTIYKNSHPNVGGCFLFGYLTI